MRVDPRPMPDFTLEDLRQEQYVYLLTDGEVNTLEQAEQWALRRFSPLFSSFVQG